MTEAQALARECISDDARALNKNIAELHTAFAVFEKHAQINPELLSEVSEFRAQAIVELIDKFFELREETLEFFGAEEFQ